MSLVSQIFIITGIHVQIMLYVKYLFVIFIAINIQYDTHYNKRECKVAVILISM